MAPELPPDFSEFLKLLNAHGVKYLIIGGYAVGFHGHPRATADIDIWVPRDTDSAQRIELLTTIAGVEFEDCAERAVDAVLGGVPVRIIGLADLKRNKRAAGRHQDLADLDHLP